MGLKKWMEAMIKKMELYDISLIKLSVAACVLLIAKIWPPLLSLEWYWYAGILVVAIVRPLCLVFSKQ
ncbi:MAG: hypothetical protein AABW92_00565 [Nanoarchaeota archaeon]